LREMAPRLLVTFQPHSSYYPLILWDFAQ
jgi:hypothetical protein